MKLKIILLFLLAISDVYAGSAQKTALIPSNWPSSDIDIQTFSEWGEEALKTPSGIIPQQALNRYHEMIAELWDARVMIAYVDLSTRLIRVEKERFKQEQEAWLKERTRISTAAAASENGGSVAATIYANAFIKNTEQRYKEICARLKEMNPRANQ